VAALVAVEAAVVAGWLRLGFRALSGLDC